MINWAWLIAKLISTAASWLDASNLRNRVYQLENDKEIMRTALEDIQRMSSGTVKDYAAKTLKKID